MKKKVSLSPSPHFLKDDYNIQYYFKLWLKLYIKADKKLKSKMFNMNRAVDLHFFT